MNEQPDKVVQTIEPQIAIPNDANWRRAVLAINAIEASSLNLGRKLAFMELAARLEREVHDITASQPPALHLVLADVKNAADPVAVIREFRDACRSHGVRIGQNDRTAAIVKFLRSEGR